MGFVPLFLDTEFTSFDSPRLISFALVAETGEALYLERSDGWTTEDCSHFVRESVLPLLGPREQRATDQLVRWAVRSWIHSLGRPAMIYTDSLWYDEPAFKSLFTDRMDLWPHALDQRFVEFDSPAVDLVFDTKGLRRHHALDDAIALKTAYLIAVQEREGS